jgi:sugar lactone lactonase YvrE
VRLLFVLTACSAVVPDVTTRQDLGVPDLAGTNLPDLTNGGGNASDLAGPVQFCQSITVATLAGDGNPNFHDGPGSSAEFHFPNDIAADTSGNLYVADFNNCRIRKLLPDGTTSTLAGNGAGGFVDGTGGPSGTTEFLFPMGVAVDTSGNVYVADEDNNRIRKVAPDGTTTTLSGNGTTGFADGTGGATGTSEFSRPWGVAVDASGFVYVADSFNARIRKLASDGTAATLSGNGTGGVVNGSGGANGTSTFELPAGLVLDSMGNLYVADEQANVIRKLTPSGASSTLAGDIVSGTSDGTGSAARFNGPKGLALDSGGNLYIADTGNDRIRRLAPDGSTLTVTGTTGRGFQDGSGCTAQFNEPMGLALVGKKLYVSDSGNNRIRVVTLP